MTDIEMTFSAGELIGLATNVLMGLGVPEDLAGSTATSLAESNLRGHDSHGIIRLVQYSTWVTDGQIRPAARPRLAAAPASGAVATVDGSWGLGQPAAVLATATAAELAHRNGAAAVSIKRCNHIGRLGEYVETLAERGLIALAMCNSGSIVAPAGGRRRTFGTNPFAWAVPRADGPPLVLDFSTAVVAEGKVRMHQARGVALPAGAVVDSLGRPTSNPADLYDGGALVAFGGHKGSGMAAMIELTGGLLSGMGASPMSDYAGGNGTVLIALDVAAFTPLAGFLHSAATFADRMVQGEDGSRDDNVLAPGEIEERTRAVRVVAGVPVPDATRMEITTIGHAVGVDLGRFALPSPTLVPDRED